jgi:hypothetical protein
VQESHVKEGMSHIVNLGEMHRTFDLLVQGNSNRNIYICYKFMDPVGQWQEHVAWQPSLHTILNRGEVHGVFCF